MDIIILCALLALRRLSPTFILPLTPLSLVLLFRSEHFWSDGWSNTFTPTTPPCVNTPTLDKHTLQHSPSLPFCKNLRIGFKCTYHCTLLLALKTCIISMSLIPLLARRRHCKLSLTSLLPTPFFTHGRTDGWSNTASPTTPPYSYIVHLALKIFVTLLNIILLQSPNPIFQCLNVSRWIAVFLCFSLIALVFPIFPF